MNIKRVVGDNIRGFRHKLGWTQEKLAIRAKLHYNYIGTVERAEDTISVANLYKISQVLKVQPHFFLIENAYQFSDSEIKALSR